MGSLLKKGKLLRLSEMEIYVLVKTIGELS